MLLLEGNICKAQVWLEETSPGAKQSLCLMTPLPTVSLQACVKERASKSMQCVREITETEALAVVESVFQTCFTDTDPFERVPP